MADRLSTYEEGIAEATKRGYIPAWEPTLEVGYDHSRGINYHNSRFLHPAANLIIRAHPENVETVLELGPGSGVAAAQMSLLLPHVKIHTAGGWSPINPYVRPVRDFFDPDALKLGTLFRSVRGKLEEAMNQKDSDPRVREILKKQWGGSIAPDVLFIFQNDFGVQIFDVLALDKPFIEKQLLGHFPSKNSDGLGDQKYDFIYENKGPHFHTGKSAIYQTAFDHLSDRGMLCMSSMGDFNAGHTFPKTIEIESNDGGDRMFLYINERHFLYSHVEHDAVMSVTELKKLLARIKPKSRAPRTSAQY